MNGLDFDGISFNSICKQKTGLSAEDQALRRSLFGPNLIEIAVQPIIKIFVTEVLNPFYIYQFAAITFWAIDHYYYYAGYILVMSIFSLAITTYQIRLNQTRLRDKVYGFDYVNVIRDNDSQERIPSSELVPGDIIELDDDRYVVLNIFFFDACAVCDIYTCFRISVHNFIVISFCCLEK